MCGGDWDGHLRRHAGQRPFMCAECPKKFRNSNQLEIQKKETQSHVSLISVIYVENIMKIPTILLNIRKCSMENQKICLVRSVVKYLSIGAG